MERDEREREIERKRIREREREREGERGEECGRWLLLLGGRHCT